MTRKTPIVALALGLTLAAGLAGAASAETRWERNHPRQDQVLDRDAHLRGDIRHEYREGDLTRGQETRLLRKDREIAREDHVMARINGGYITKGEHRLMNRQETRLDRHIPG
jgi:hypothetical protein